MQSKARHERQPMVLAALTFMAVLALVVNPARAKVELSVEPTEVSADLFYDGAIIEVTTSIPTGVEAAVVLRGPDSSVVLKRIGRVLGFLWMKTGEIKPGSMPVLYKVHTTRHWPTDADSFGVGYRAMASNANLDDETLEEFVKLKEREGMYSERRDVLQVRSSDPGLRVLHTSFFLPAKAPQGDYRVLLFLWQGGAVVERTRSSVRVERVGVAAFLVSLALNHGFLYGILSVVVALAAGLIAGRIFNAGRGSGH